MYVTIDKKNIYAYFRSVFSRISLNCRVALKSDKGTILINWIKSLSRHKSRITKEIV